MMKKLFVYPTGELMDIVLCFLQRISIKLATFTSLSEHKYEFVISYTTFEILLYHRRLIVVLMYINGRMVKEFVL